MPYMVRARGRRDLTSVSLSRDIKSTPDRYNLLIDYLLDTINRRYFILKCYRQSICFPVRNTGLYKSQSGAPVTSPLIVIFIVILVLLISGGRREESLVDLSRKLGEIRGAWYYRLGYLFRKLAAPQLFSLY